MNPSLRRNHPLPLLVQLAFFAFILVAFFIVLSEKDDPREALLQLRLDTDKEAIAQIFWRLDEQEYSQKQSRTFTLTPGINTYRIVLPKRYDIARLRFDPATRSSIATLYEITLQWDGRVIFNLSGTALAHVLYAAGQVVIEPVAGADTVLLTSTGIDPSIEIDMAAVTRGFRFIQQLKVVAWALLPAALLTLGLCYVSSATYAAYAHRTYPKRPLHWFLWVAVFWVLGLYFYLVIPAVPPQSVAMSLYLAAWSIVVGSCLFIPAFWFVTRQYRTIWAAPPLRLQWLWFALPSLFVWSFYLVAMWPGSMSPDSLIQWREMLHGKYDDWNPAFHTMTIWLLTRLWMSPAIVAVAQIISLALVAGWGMSVLQHHGVPRQVLLCTSFLFALIPVNGLMAVTLWKDVAYSCAMLALVICLFQIVMTRGEWLAYRLNWLLLGIILVLLSLYRHNGIGPAIATIIVLMICFPRYWRTLSLAVLCAAMVYGGVKGPLYNALDVQRSDPLAKVAKRLSSDLFSLPEKNSETNVIDSKAIDKVSAEKPSVPFLQVVMERIHSTSRLWRIQPLTEFHIRIEYVNMWRTRKGSELSIRYMSGNDLGYSEHSLLPILLIKISRFFDWSRSEGLFSLMWRPAVFLYALTGLLAMLSWRLRLRLYLLLVPLLANSLPYFLMVIHKSVFRYHYPLVVTGLLLIIPLLFLRPVEPESELERYGEQCL